MVFLGDLEHGVYDECSDLTEEEVNAFYGFNSNGHSLEDGVEEIGSESEVSDSEELMDVSSSDNSGMQNAIDNDSPEKMMDRSDNSRAQDENDFNMAVRIVLIQIILYRVLF